MFKEKAKSIISKRGTYMIVITRNLMISLLAAAVILLAGCGTTSSTVVTTPAPVKTDVQQSEQPSVAQSSTQTSQVPAQTEPKPGSNVSVSTGAKPAEPLSTRVDVIYFHVVLPASVLKNMLTRL
jgi:hypothetical protein